MSRRHRLSIAHVTPHPWGPPNEVNDFVERVSEELTERGHNVVIAAPSDSRADIRESRRAIAEARDGNGDLFARGKPRVLLVGQSIPLPRSANAARLSLPVDVNRTLERLLGSFAFDVVHVHEPFAPSAASAALRHSRTLNVGTFHEPAERVLSTQVARPLVDIFLGRLDARTVSHRVTADLLDRAFPGDYELIPPGADAVSRRPGGRGALRILFCPGEERGALRLFLRALRLLPAELEWRATIRTDRLRDPAIRLSRVLADRVEVIGPDGPGASELMAAADVLCLGSGGSHPAPGTVQQGIAAGAVPIVPDIPLYVELVDRGERGLVYGLGSADELSARLASLVEDRDRLKELRDRGRGGLGARSWSRVADEVEAVYERVTSRRQSARIDTAARRRIAQRPFIHCDLHMHTDHSWDCATPTEVLLETARDRGLGAIAITDHNEISGAFEARDIAETMEGIKVIVGEEVKTADEGEVIGLFLTEKIEKGLTMAETVAEIRRQGGLVYVPHPFDRLHTVPDYEHLLKIVDDVDILEVFNPRVAFSAFNEEAVRFAQKYRIVAGAGSDSHVAQGLGSVRIKLHDFEGPAEFLEAMRDADIVRKHKNLVYVQALKFLQTTGRPRPARRARAAKEARPVRGGRPRAAGRGRGGSGRSGKS